MKILCPCCGKQYDVEKFQGYDFEELLAIAAELGRLGYGPEKLHEVMQNLSNAFDYCWNHMKTTFDTAIINELDREKEMLSFIGKIEIDPDYVRKPSEGYPGIAHDLYARTHFVPFDGFNMEIRKDDSNGKPND